MTDRQARLAARYFGLLIIAYLLFIGFASFYLTDGVSPGRLARAGFDELFFLEREFRLRWYNLRDIATNLLLYMPLGCLVCLFLAAAGNARLTGWALGWGAILSIGVEIVQAFIGRFSDATDVVSNGGGYLLGFVIARTAVRHYKLHPAALLGMSSERGQDRLNTLAGLRFVYVAVALITCLLPLDISVSMTEVYGKLQASAGQMPRLIVDPLYHFATQVSSAQYLTLKLLLFLPVAFLSSLIQLRRGRPSLLIPAFHCLLFAVVIESANLFVQSNRSDTIVPVIAFFCGLITGGIVLRFASHSSVRMSTALVRDRLYLFVSAGLLYCLLVIAIALSPYEFELSVRAIRSKLLEETNLVPFRLHFSARSIAAAVDIVREFILYAPLGTLVALGLRGLPQPPSTHLVLAVALFFGGFFALWIESLQLAVVNRYVDITDVLLATAGSMAGAIMAPLFSRGVARGA